MKVNPPHRSDWSMVARMKRIGFEPGKFENKLSGAPLEVAKGNALKLMKSKLPTLAKVKNGWQMNTDTVGVYGNYYLKRAIVAQVGLGANQPEDAIYPLALADSEGKPIVGKGTSGRKTPSPVLSRDTKLTTNPSVRSTSPTFNKTWYF